MAASHSKVGKTLLALEFPSVAIRQGLTDSMVSKCTQNEFIFNVSENNNLPDL
jgi:hypothetical protein